jgi:hypothetical protein
MQALRIGLDPIRADSLNRPMPSFELDPREVERFARPIASELTRPQAVTLAEALNLAATGEAARSSQIKYG